MLNEARSAGKAEKADFAQLSRDADTFSGFKDTLTNIAPTDWSDMIATIREAPTGVDKTQTLEDYDSFEPRRKWKGKSPKKVKLKTSGRFSPRLRKVNEVKS